MGIHSTAIIEDGAEIGDGVVIGPMCHVGAKAKLSDRVVLHNAVIVSGDTTIGAGTTVHAFAALGGPPQHLKYDGEPTRLEIGDDVIIREHVTMNLGTAEGGGVTRVGDRGFFMTGAHVAHDCQVGADAIFANNATLGGHVVIGEGAFLGGLSAIHQFCRVGEYAFVGGCAAVAGDIIPYASAFGNHARLSGLNIIGMKRRNMAREVIHKLRGAYRLLFEGEGAFADRLEEARQTHAGCPEVGRILAFIDNGASRSLMTPGR
jgi:UDP-N-acetylglucosamine acyltransferase